MKVFQHPKLTTKSYLQELRYKNTKNVKNLDEGTYKKPIKNSSFIKSVMKDNLTNFKKDSFAFIQNNFSKTMQAESQNCSSKCYIICTKSIKLAVLAIKASIQLAKVTNCPQRRI